MRRNPAVPALAFAALLAGALALGCKRDEPADDKPDLVEEAERADEEGEASGEPAEVVDVLLTDKAVEISGAISPGRTRFRVRNGGTEKHSFALDGREGRVELEEPIAPQRTVTVEAELPEGLYTVFCPVKGHRGSMPQQVVVTSRAR